MTERQDTTTRIYEHSPQLRITPENSPQKIHPRRFTPAIILQYYFIENYTCEGYNIEACSKSDVTSHFFHSGASTLRRVCHNIELESGIVICDLSNVPLAKRLLNRSCVYFISTNLHRFYCASIFV